MKINTNSNQAFCYNLQYHNRIWQKLESKKRENVQLAKYLSQADKYSLEIEDEIIELEKLHKDKTQSYLNLCDYLIDFKDILALNMETYFPGLKYAKNLYKQYQDEAKDVTPDKFNWREGISKIVSQYIVTDKTSAAVNSEKEDPKDEKLKEESQRTAENFQQQAIDDYMEKKSNELLTKFNASNSSSKGFKSVVGMDSVKQKLKEEIIDYITTPSKIQADLEEYGIGLPRGFLLYGPPGCGKTFVIESLAIESGLDLYKLDISKAGSKYVNQSANNIEQAFEYLRLAAIKNNAPVLLFMDEADSLAMCREDLSTSSGENEKVTTTLLKRVQQARDENIIVIAATNKFNNLDEAFKNRFDSQIYIGLPSQNQIKALVKSELDKRLKGKNLANNEKALDLICEKLEGYSNRSIVFIIDAAAKLAKRNNREEIKEETVLQAIEECDFEKINDGEYRQNKKRTVIGFK